MQKKKKIQCTESTEVVSKTEFLRVLREHAEFHWAIKESISSHWSSSKVYSEQKILRTVLANHGNSAL